MLVSSGAQLAAVMSRARKDGLREKEEGQPPMPLTTRTSSELFAAALLGATLLGAAPAASARTPMKTFTVMFAYNTADPADKIYAALKHTAHKACHARMNTAFHAVNTTRTCTKNVIEAALKAMVRTDIAALHFDRNA
jgi:hypothetical protein